MDHLDLENRFTFHPAKGDQPERYGAIRGMGRTLAHYLNEAVPESREKSLAITHLEEVVFWANAAIARNEVWSDTETGASDTETKAQ
jgi:hypothetical protein